MSSLIWSSPSSPSPHHPHHLVSSPQLLLLFCAITLITLITPTTHGQLLYSPPSSPIHYKPVISMAVPAAAAAQGTSAEHNGSSSATEDHQPQHHHPQPVPQSMSTRLYSGWTPVRTSSLGSSSSSSSSSSPASASLNSVYTAINPVLGTNKYGGTAAPVSAADTAPSSATASASTSATASTGNSVNSNSSSINGYLFSESIARNSYQKMPSQQSTYMIQPAKYRAAFSSTRNTTPTTTTNNSTSSNKTTSVKSASIVRSPKSSKSSKIINSEVMPIPLIKPHRHGATLGFNLPDQGLTLYLDINELATKPMAQNIGLKVVSHAKSGDDLELEEVREELNEVKPAKSNKVLRKRVTKVLKKQGKDGKTVTIVTGAAKSSTREGKSSRLQGNIPTTTTLPPLPGSTKRIKFSGSGTKTKSASSGSKLNNHFLSPANKAKQQQQQQQQQNQVIEIPSLNHQVDINSEKIFADLDKQQQGSSNLTRNDIPPTASRIPSTYVSQRKEGESEPSPPSSSTTNILGGGIDDDLPDLIKEAGPGAEPPSEEPIVKVPTTTTTTASPTSTESEEEEESGEATGENETDSDNVERSVNAEDAAAAEELEEAIEEENERGDEQGVAQTTTTNSLSVDDSDEEEEEERTGPTTTPSSSSFISPTTFISLPGEEAALRVITTTTTPPSTTSSSSLSDNEVDGSLGVSKSATPPPPQPTLNASSQARQQEAVDNKFVSQMQSLLEKSAQLVDISAQTCSAAVSRCQKGSSCEPNFSPLIGEQSPTMSLRELATQLGANQVLNEASSFEAELQDAVDFNTGGYTLLLPSNEAIGRLPPSLLRRWKSSKGGEVLSAEVYLLDGAHSLESLAAKGLVRSRGRQVRLHFAHPHNATYTVNGQRVVVANQKAPGGGLVHVIDGLLYPHSDKDIIDTLKACGRLDGFVTLAEGTGFASTLRKEGPFTVFVPSNDALQKVPDTDLEVIRRNMTALREFLKYHVAEGVFYSQDLVDGQFLPSLLEGEYLQAGVRVDGCTRRLVEVNVSPLYRADIPASNGVIHVVDWILKPDDRDWCNGVILPRRR